MNLMKGEQMEQKREQILEIAFDLFLTIGYEATTVRMICRKAEIEAPTIYYYFGSKRGLFFAVVDWILIEYGQLKTKSELDTYKSPEEKLRMIFMNSIQYAMTYTRQTKFYLRYTLFIPEELKDDINSYMEKTYEQRNTLYRKLVKECLDRHCSETEIENSYRKMKTLVDDCTFNVVFSGWSPEESEIIEIWDIFYHLQLKGTPYLRH